MNPALPQIGDVVAAKYRIEKIVGEGGMGIIYAAHHLMLDQRVAVKVLLVDVDERGEEIVERFVREAQAAARVKSDHVVRVMDAGSLDSGLPFLVMEYLEGCDLDDLLLRNGPLAHIDVCDYMLQVLAALAQAHAAGIVHRDLKPANIFLRAPDGGPDLVKILDFGISKQDSQRAGWKQLTGQTCLGTPAYMSPEQLRSSKNVDPRADLWSVGVAMYELLTKKLPFDGESPTEIFSAILEQSPAPLSTHRKDVPEGLERIIMRALQRDPERRFADAAEFARALGPYSSGRWEHLLEETARAAGRIRKIPSASSAAIVVAAIAAAHVSMAPPMGAVTPLAFDVRQKTTELEISESEMPAARANQASRFARVKVAFATAAAAGLVVLAMFGHGRANADTRHFQATTYAAAKAAPAIPPPPSVASVVSAATPVESPSPIAVSAAPETNAPAPVSSSDAPAKHVRTHHKHPEKRAPSRPMYVPWKD